MPNMVTLEANPDFKTENPEEKAAFAKIKKRKPFQASFVSAMQSVKLSKGMYRIKAEEKQPTVSAATLLEDMTTEQLKETAVGMGMTIAKQRMSKADLLKSIRSRLSNVKVTEDGE